MDVPSVRLIMPGGILRRESNSLSGPMAEAALANLQADRLYLGADGLDPEIGVMTPHLPEARAQRQDDRASPGRWSWWRTPPSCCAATSR